MTPPQNTPKPIKLFNTRSRKVAVLETQVPGTVALYCCGPTVYNFQHIGNLRTYIFEDVLVRTLRYSGYAVNHVMNITDVGHLVSDADDGEDKMAVAAKREKKSSHEIANYYTEVFFADCAKLNIKRPSIVCKATEHIAEMIALIKRLEARGMTYQAGGNVYYNVDKFPTYGELAKLDLSKMKAGARVDVDANKKSPFDFVLWFTKSKFENQELTWDSPWGRGYPGWHIECSAMSMKYLGDAFDLHCGGIDHIPVHHTNEIAQSEGATGSCWVKHWMHGDFLLINSDKMAKSKGNFYTLQTLIDQGFDPLAYRFLVLSASYRAQLNFTTEALEGAANNLKKLKTQILALKAAETGPIVALAQSSPAQKYLQEFEAAYLDDLNSPKALAALWALLGDSNVPSRDRLTAALVFDEIFGLGMASWKEESVAVPAEVLQLAELRNAARAAKNWSESDRLRDEIAKRGFKVLDGAGGGKIVPT